MTRLWVLALSLGACAPSVVTPDTSRAGAFVAARPQAVSGLVLPGSWQGRGLAAAPETRECPEHKAELERALGVKAADACPIVREQAATPIGDGDAPVAAPVAPHCYALGDAVLVVQYLEKRTTCTEIVGIAVLPRK